VTQRAPISEPANATDSLIRQTVRHARRLVILVVGLTVVTIGIAGIVLPMIPAIVLIPAGIAILATEFVWARRLLRRIRTDIQAMRGRKADF
jgi:uncharacterized protein YqgC (DUF456 family)